MSTIYLQHVSSFWPHLVSVDLEESASAGSLFGSFNTRFVDKMIKDLVYAILKNDACAAAVPLTSSVWPERLGWAGVFLDVSSAAHGSDAAI